jgi:hypothetical protein
MHQSNFVAACKARRATCPEIILSNAEDMQHRSVIHCLAELHGNCGNRINDALLLNLRITQCW